MKKQKIKTQSKKIIADTVTPVNLYLKFRDKFSKCLLLESSDYNSKENNSKSFLCIRPISTIKIQNNKLDIFDSENRINSFPIDNENFNELFDNYIKSIELYGESEIPYNGLYGYLSYNAVEYFETLKLNNPKKDEAQIPSLNFSFFKYVLVFNHFNSDITIVENLLDSEDSQLTEIEEIINSSKFCLHKFETLGEELSNITDDEYIEMVKQGKKHCKRGDVFQIVLSRQFNQKFLGDDFNVYRALRSINPSPYLFYFDYGNFKLFGSSPEAQIKISNNKVLINPIAGTYRRTGNAIEDKKLAKKLLLDKKENAEHVMLVDLARNDISRNGKNVVVEIFKEIQYFSHVIHLVSTVQGDYTANKTKIIADTFPAGTLTGAPKYKAMQLIDKYENQDRGYYGGAVGFIGLSGEVNLAITIRSFISKNNKLFYQAGAGIVEQSDEISELNEVNNKLSALKKAVKTAENI
jgi:anthranilate synthase component 1